MTRDPLYFGFRRRCGWCGRVLRGWQLNLCRGCNLAVNSDIGGIKSSPPCPRMSCVDAPADTWRTQ